ncbi:MAG: AAA family ATPase [Bacteroides sp.]|nr:AAA family ATPase [Bacteroides sp.]
MKSIYIKNFKNIQELTIPKLARVNLIVGKNSVGKSTLLEALSIYLSKGNEVWLRELLESRGEILVSRQNDKETQEVFNGQSYLSLFTGREENYSKNYAIRIGESSDDNEAVQINQVWIVTEEKQDVFGGGIMFRRRAFTTEDLADSTDNTLNIEGKGLEVSYGNNKVIISYRKVAPRLWDYKTNFQYVHTIDFQTDKNAILFDSIALTPEEKYIIQALQIIHPKITRINFLNVGNVRMGREPRVPIVTFEGDNNKYLLSAMGDGINRILTIVLAMLNCKGGTLLLDEFETGLHYSVQDELWRIIFMLAEELDIQVFVTTHSNDCVNSFARVNEKDNGMIIRLEERKGSIKAVSYTNNEELKFATMNNIEIR